MEFDQVNLKERFTGASSGIFAMGRWCHQARTNSLVCHRKKPEREGKPKISARWLPSRVGQNGCDDASLLRLRRRWKSFVSLVSTRFGGCAVQCSRAPSRKLPGPRIEFVG